MINTNPSHELTKIYLVTNCYGDPNKVYIGKTINSRLCNHKRKFGKDITYDYIDEVNSLKPIDYIPLECFWILYFKFLGFDVQNRNVGGGGLSHHSEETKLLISDKMKGKKHSEETRIKRKKSLKGRVFSDETKIKLGISNKGKGVKPILQYDLEGNFIKEWPSVVSAGIFYSKNCNLFGVSRSHTNGKRAFGYLWRLKTDDYPIKIEAYKRSKCPQRKCRIILQFDINGILIKEWDGIKFASNELKINSKDINSCCRGKIKTAGKFKWSYK